MSIVGIIYDVDGTMVDSEPLHLAAWESALAHSGRHLADLPESFRAVMAGQKPLAIAAGMVASLHLKVRPEQLLRTKTDRFMALVASHLGEMPGATASIKRLASAGFKLGIGSALDRAYVDLVTTRLAVRSYFAAVTTGDQVMRGKPDPETYQKAAAALDLSPSQCLVLEDAASGIRAAIAAGCACIAVVNQNAPKQDTTGATLVVSSLDEVTAARVHGLG